MVGEQDIDKMLSIDPKREAGVGFYKKLAQRLEVFDGCGNVLGVVPLTEADYPDASDFREDPELRGFLQRWGREIGSDSVMVLTGHPGRVDELGYHYAMFVFEPNGEDLMGLPGGISTMCGNGVRAVAAFLRQRYPIAVDARIMTLSGIRIVEFDEDLFTVDMGKLTFNAADLETYVDSSQAFVDGKGRYLDVPIPESIVKQLSPITSAKSWSIGLTGDRINGRIDGEPHVVIEIPANEASDLVALRKIAVGVGPIITKNSRLFPKEINVNLIIQAGSNEDKKMTILNCTHERNLGNDAEHSVTQACGTGSTVAAGFIMEKNSGLHQVEVKCLGGNLTILKKSGSESLFMKGPAVKVGS